MKKMMTVLLAGALVAGLTMPVLADDVGVWNKKIDGTGQIGIFDFKEESIEPYIKPVEVNALEIDGTQAVAGATITVMFPTSLVDVDDQSYARDGETPGMYIEETFNVPASTDGTWLLAAPAGADMSKDMKIYAWQKEDDVNKSRSKRVVVTIGNKKGSEFDKDDKPEPPDVVDPSAVLDVTLPRDFIWYVNQDTGKTVKSASHEIRNNGTIYTDENNNKMNAKIQVNLASFEASQETIDSGILSKLTLNMIDKGSTDPFTTIANLQAGTVSDESLGLIDKGETIKFGFDGLWDDDLPSGLQEFDFTMQLHITIEDLY